MKPARPSLELDRTRDQLGHPPRWTEHATSSAIRRTGLVQFGGWPSLNDRAVFISSSQLPPLGLERMCYCFISIGVTVGTSRFKNRKNSFSRITFGLIV
ncbi:hypothetical protein F2Q69_00059426 [Brassica cretica]|uniref:Uncharacterized protein n=1 Tax=Brassica cretica TaxID=69181 RepID=A0A8S9RRI5_BRACR|nr:hypothetical protein F2Q69_00059426 [Brassica cretica]